jgi:hypothetical protein
MSGPISITCPLFTGTGLTTTLRASQTLDITSTSTDVNITPGTAGDVFIDGTGSVTGGAITLTTRTTEVINLNGGLIDENKNATEFNYMEAGGVDPDRFIVVDQKTAATHGGASSAATTQARDLNTEIYKKDSVSGFLLAANQVQMNQGVYKFIARAPAYRVDEHQAIISPVSGTVTGNGLGSAAMTQQTGSAVTTFSAIDTVLTVTSATAIIELKHYTQLAQATFGLGLLTPNLLSNIYSYLEIIRIGD